MEIRCLGLVLVAIALLGIIAESIPQGSSNTPPQIGEVSPPRPQNKDIHESMIKEKQGIRKTNPRSPMILVHDVTPYYFDDLRELVAVLDEYNYSNRTVLFVIPIFDPDHYGDKWSLRNHPDFVGYLRELQRRGYRVELHGYGHTYHEFNCSYETAKEKLNNATTLMASLGFGNLTLFLPPAWALNNESLRAILEHNLTVVTPDWLIFPNGTKQRIWNREYTWYIGQNEAEGRLSVAIHDYRKAIEQGIPFYLSVHLGVINYGGGLDFLRDFLDAVCCSKKS